MEQRQRHTQQKGCKQDTAQTFNTCPLRKIVILLKKARNKQETVGLVQQAAPAGECRGIPLSS